MYCTKCGKQIDDEAVFCVGCGVPTNNMQKFNQQQNTPPIIINNSTVASAAVIGRKRRSLLFDIFMIFITGGLWIIWMLIRR